jgi:hypothetical protein
MSTAFNPRQKKGEGGPAEVHLQFDWRLREVMSHVRRNMQEMLTEAGDDAVKIMNALAPVDTGALKGSIRTEDLGRGVVVLRVGTEEIDYAAAIEFGTKRGVASNPFVIPSIRFARSNAREKAAKGRLVQ